MKGLNFKYKQKIGQLPKPKSFLTYNIFSFISASFIYNYGFNGKLILPFKELKESFT